MQIDWRSVCRLIPTVLVMGLIFTLSHQEGASLSLPPIPFIDKVGHFFLYGILAAVVLFALPVEAYRSRIKLSAAAVILFCLVYGISDEFHQTFIPGRDASIYDLIADFLGASALVILWFRYRCLCRHQDSRKGLPSGNNNRQFIRN